MEASFETNSLQDQKLQTKITYDLTPEQFFKVNYDVRNEIP